MKFKNLMFRKLKGNPHRILGGKWVRKPFSIGV
jgi:hypothetical protein